MRLTPWHQIGGTHYHDQLDCDIGRLIDPTSFRGGDGGLPRCPVCERLDHRTPTAATPVVKPPRTPPR